MESQHSSFPSLIYQATSTRGYCCNFTASQKLNASLRQLLVIVNHRYYSKLRRKKKNKLGHVVIITSFLSPLISPSDKHVPEDQVKEFW